MNAEYGPGEEGGVEPPRPAGVLDSVKRMLATLVALVHTRLELFTTEIEEEIQRAASILVWAIVALFFGSLTVLMIAVTILVVFWDDNRILAAGLITGTFLLLTIIFVMLARARLREKPRFMSASIDELKRDRESLERPMMRVRVELAGVHMLKHRLDELALRRQRLLLRSTRLRQDLAVDQHYLFETLSNVDRAVATARSFVKPALFGGLGLLAIGLLRRRVRGARGAGFAMRALMLVSTARRLLPFVAVLRAYLRSRSRRSDDPESSYRP